MKIKRTTKKRTVARAVERPRVASVGILERSAFQLNDLFTGLVQKPEVSILLVFALVLSISNMNAGTGKDIMSEMITKLNEVKALKSFADLLKTYQKEAVAILWFAGVYGAVPVRSRTMVILVAMITILALDYTMMQTGVVAVAVYLFFSVKDKQVRIVAICIALGYTYITYFSKDSTPGPVPSPGKIHTIHDEPIVHHARKS